MPTSFLIYIYFLRLAILAKLYSRNRDFPPAPVCVIDRLISRRNVRSKRILTVIVSCVTNFKFNRKERIEAKELDTTEGNSKRAVCMYLRFAQKQSYVIESFHETWKAHEKHVCISYTLIPSILYTLRILHCMSVCSIQVSMSYLIWMEYYTRKDLKETNRNIYIYILFFLTASVIYVYIMYVHISYKYFLHSLSFRSSFASISRRTYICRIYAYYCTYIHTYIHTYVFDCESSTHDTNDKVKSPKRFCYY